MDLREYMLLLLRRWQFFVGTVVLVSGAMIAGSFFVPAVYQASIAMSVRTDPGKANANLGADGSSESAASQLQKSDLLAVSRIKTYARTVNSESVLDPVIADLELDTSFNSLNRSITTEVPANTSILIVNVTAGTAAEAANIANAVAAQVPIAVAALEGEASSVSSPTQFTVIQRALPPTARISPNLKLNAAIAILLGLALGVFVAVLVETFDSRLRRGAQVVASGGRYLGGIRDLSSKEVARLQSPTDLPADVQTLLDRIGVEVLFAAGSAPTSLVVTSPRPAAGATTLASGIALGLVKNGNRVVYLDLSSPESRLATAIQMPGSSGLTDIMTGRIELDAALYYWERGGFTVIPHGAATMNAAEMLGGEEFAQLLSTLEDLFDVVIIDAPDIRSSTDAGLLIRSARNTVLVAQARKTKRKDYMEALDAVTRAQGRLVGVVLNRVSRSSSVEEPIA